MAREEAGSRAILLLNLLWSDLEEEEGVDFCRRGAAETATASFVVFTACCCLAFAE